MKLLNAFSLAMLQLPAVVEVREVALEVARQFAKEGLESFVGHAEACSLYSEMLGCAVPMNRVSVKLERGERALVGQYAGPRLPEGATTLPPGAAVKWLVVEVLVPAEDSENAGGDAFDEL